MSVQSIKKHYTNGEEFLVTGWYKYKGHVEENNIECFVPTQSGRMLFKKGEVAPMLGSCAHAIRWEFISKY